MRKYSIHSEYRTDVENIETKKESEESKKIFLDFYDKFYAKLDLNYPDSIIYTYRQADKSGIFSLAREIRELFFEKDIHFYGVSYLWDHCINDCKYCPGSTNNRKKANYQPRELTIEEAIKDTFAIMHDGHTHICYLSGDDPVGHPISLLKTYLVEIDKIGLDEIILNMPPLSLDKFKSLRSSVKNTPVQYRVFQETYSKTTYSKLHNKGPKKKYEYRFNALERALNAGFDNVGIGALFGLHKYPLEEIFGLMQHSNLIYQKFGIYPIRVCLPSANFLPNIGVEIPYILEKGIYTEEGELLKYSYYEMLVELVYALSKLAMPNLSLVSSERDPKGLLKILDNYSTCTVLNVHPGVGDKR